MSRQKKSDYVFMWSSKPLLPSYYATPWAVKDRTDVYPSASVFQYFDGEIMTAYMPMQDLNMFREQDSPKYLDPDFFKQYRENYSRESREWWSYIRAVEKKDYASVSKVELTSDHEKFVLYNRDAIAYFGSTRTEFTFAPEQKLESLLKKYYGNRWTEAFAALTTSLELDDVQKEYLDWLELLEKDPTDDDLLAHISLYPWLVIGEFSEANVIEHMRERISAETGVYEKKLAEHKKHKAVIQKRQNSIYSLVGKDISEVQYVSEFLQTQSVERMNIKSYWGGSYFLARNMWKRLAQELELDLWDLLLYVSPPETQDLLHGTYSGDIATVIKQRRDGYVINFEPGGEIVFLQGKQAEEMLNEKVQPEDHSVSEITGQTAALGKYTGRVRKVMPGDLAMLKDDIKKFQKGEVLVTSMTQPNMMVIAEKAGAIVTDEGGITSHAAIISRELKVPCIVGCFIAMKALEDGDMVEVDADNGVVRKIEEN